MSEGSGTANREIRQLIETSMTSLIEMVDVNTVVGELIETSGNVSIIPISKVSCGFVAGGGEYGQASLPTGSTPFAGGSGAGVSVQPVGFLVGYGNTVRFIAVSCSSPVDRAIEALPGLVDQLKTLIGKQEQE